MGNSVPILPLFFEMEEDAGGTAEEEGEGEGRVESEIIGLEFAVMGVAAVPITGRTDEVDSITTVLIEELLFDLFTFDSVVTGGLLVLNLLAFSALLLPPPQLVDILFLIFPFAFGGLTFVFAIVDFAASDDVTPLSHSPVPSDPPPSPLPVPPPCWRRLISDISFPPFP